MKTATQEKYRDKLRDLRAELVHELQSDADAIAEDVRSPGDLSDVPNHPGDIDSEGVAERVALGEMEREMVEQIDVALRRIEEGTFGRCESCGRAIPRQRLDAIPFTPYCIECAREQEAELEG